MDPLLISIFILLFFLSAFFSWTELALMTLATHKVDALVKSWKFWALPLKKIKEKSDRLLITILIWNNLVNTYTAALATTIAMDIAINAGIAQAQAIGISTWIVTFLLLIFWEIIPKSFATKNATTISLLVAPIYKFLMIILLPIIIMIEFIIKIFNLKEWDSRITWEEIESFIDMTKDSWTLEHKEHEKIKNILEFWDINVEEIMTPRVQIVWLNIDTTVKDALKFYRLNTHSRIPVYEWSIDNINYFLTVRDLLSAPKDKILKDLSLSRVIKIPLNQPIDNLLETFQKSHKHLAIVMDEYWWVSGLITLEDIIEEIFWEIRDETDKELDDIKKNWKNSYIIESTVLMRDILSKFNISFNKIWLDEKKFDSETVGYIITDKIERFPLEGEIINFNVKWKVYKEFIFKVLWVKKSKIEKIEVTLVKKKV